MSVSDASIAGILEIPPAALRAIKDAEAGLVRIHDASRKAAGQVYNDFSKRMPMGIDVFIRKLAEAKQAMDKVGTVNVTLNTNAAVQTAEKFTSTMQKTQADVSKAAQQMASVWNEQLLGMKAPLGADKIINVDNVGKKSIDDIINSIETLKKERDQWKNDKPRSNGILGDLVLTRQQLTDLITYLEKGVAQWKTYSGAQNEALSKMQKTFDDKTLKEYNKHLQDQIKYQTQLNELQSKIAVRVAGGGNKATADELKQMQDLKTKITGIDKAIDTTAAKYGQLSEEGKKAWSDAYIDSLRKKQEANIKLTDKEREALERLRKSQQTQSGSDYLSQQKTMLESILNLRRQINEQAVKVASNRLTGASTLKQDEADLRKLVETYNNAKTAYAALNAEKRAGLSESAKIKAENADLKQQNTLFAEQRKYLNDMLAALSRRKEYLNQPLKARMGSSDESVIQRQLNTDYKEMLRVIKRLGEIRAKAAEQGRTANADERALIDTLIERYKMFKANVDSLSGAYQKMSDAAARSFAQDKSLQRKENAAALTEAHQKGLKVIEKVEAERAKADAKALAAGDRKIAQQEKQIARQEARDKKAADDYEKWWLKALERVEAERAKADATRNTQRQTQAAQDAERRAKSQANAEKEVNDILNKRIELQQKITALNTKQSLAALSDPKAKLNFTDAANLSKYEQQMASLEARLREIGALYPKLANDSRIAFDKQKVDLLALSLQKINEAQAKMASVSSSTKATSVEDQLNKLYAERLKLLRDKNTLEDKDLLNTARGKKITLTLKESALLSEINKKLVQNESAINAIGNTYAGLAKKAKNAFAYEELKQNIVLQARFNKELDSINNQKARALASEYKSLIPTIQRLAEQMRNFRMAGGDVNSASYKNLLAELYTLSAREKQIRIMSISEVEAFREQRARAAYQADISHFIQAEAKKTAIAKSEAEKRAAENIARQKTTYQYAFASYRQLTRGSGVSRDRLTDSYQNREIVIKRLESAIYNLNKADADYERKLTVLTVALRDLKKAQNEVKDAMKPVKTPVDAQAAVQTARNTKALKDYENAYKALKATMSGMDSTSLQWYQMNVQAREMKANIDRIRSAMGEFHNQTNRIRKMLDQLKNQLALVFSVSAIKGYVNQVIKVRAQFELQNVALRAILQNKEEADRIFSQVQNMALQSPFTIMQLTTYTKQLAAYRIEANKLVGTTKMLADVSAGLGVDMQRLILAYGQVKAANYLRATEVRQFTEAGLNIAGELAQYFSELQGRMISVGDVMEMITKRMVRFEDVEEVFKRVTSAGGLFYDMQKKQSETLHGQLQRIQDAYSIMLNEIGKDNQGALSTVLKTIRFFIEQWRTIAKIISVATGATAAFFLTCMALKKVNLNMTLFAPMARYIKSVGVAIKANGGLLASLRALSTTQFIMLAGAVMAAYFAVKELTSSTSALNDELQRVVGESMEGVYESIFKFRELADTATDVTKSYKERSEAMEEINRSYKDILPAYMLEIEYLSKTRDGYKEATEVIKTYGIEKAKSAAKDTVDAETEKSWTTLINHMKDFADQLMFGQTWEQDVPEAAIKGAVGRIMMIIKDEIQSGELEVNQAWSRFKRLFKDFTDLDIKENWYTDIFKSFFGERALTWVDFYDDIYDVVENGNDALLAFEEEFREGFTKENQHIVELYNERRKAMNDFYSAMQNYMDIDNKGELTDNEGNFTMLGQSAVNDIDEALSLMNQYRQELGLVPIAYTDVITAMDNNTDALLYFDGVQKEVLGSFLSNLKKVSTDNSILAWVGKTERELRASGLSDLQIDLMNLAKEMAGSTKMSMSLLDKLKISANTNYTSAAKDAKQLSDQAADNIKKIAATRTEILLMAKTAGRAMSIAEAQAEAEKRHGNGATEEELKKQQEFWLRLAKLYGYSEKEKKKGSGRTEDAQLKRWQEIKKAIEEANKSFEKYRKDYTKDESTDMIYKQYDKVFKQLGVKMSDFYKNLMYDAEAFAKALDILSRQVMPQANTEQRKKFVNDLMLEIEKTNVEIGIKAREADIQKFKQDIDDLFANYELGKELTGFGLDIDLTYVVGGRPVTLDDIRRQIQNLQALGTAESEEKIKILKDAEKRITDIEHKNRIEQLKNYNKYLLESMSERVRIEIQAQRDISKIRNDATLDDTTKEMAVLRRQQQMREDMSKNEWKNFQGSDIYISMFEDMQQASTQSLQYILDKLKLLRESLKDLPADQLRAIVKQIESVQSEIYSRNPFKALKDNIGEAVKAFRDLESASRAYREANEKYDAAVRNRDIYAKATTNLAENLSIERAKLGVNEDGEQIESHITIELARQLKLRKEALAAMNGNIEELDEERKSLGDIVKGLKEGKDAAGQSLQTIGSWASQIGGGISDVATSMENVFGTMSEGTKDTIESISSILNGVGDMASGVGKIMKGDYVGGGIQALSGLAKTIGEVFAIGDKKKEREIKRITEQVEKLDKAYQKLEKSIEKAFTVDQYNAAYKQMQDNLNEQIKQTEEMIRLEESKKKSDKEKVKEMTENLEALKEKQKELREQRISDMGSTTDYLSEAESFVSAWLDAYKEVGEGTDALKDNWDSFIDNLFVRQAAMALVSKRIQKYIAKINNAIDEGKSDFDLSQIVREATDKFKGEADAINEVLKQLAGAFGIKGGSGDFILSDLQKGVSNMTEPQAAAVEAYLNSIRFAVFKHTEQLNVLINSIQAQYGSGESPILNEVKGIRAVLERIDGRLASVISYRVGRGDVINVA